MHKATNNETEPKQENKTKKEKVYWKDREEEKENESVCEKSVRYKDTERK